MVSHRLESKIQAPFHGKQAHGRSGSYLLLKFHFIPFFPESLSPATLTLFLCLNHSKLVPLPPGFALNIYSVRKSF